MPHTCHACLITCQDFRLHQRKDGRNYVAEFIKNLGIDCDLITRAGGVKDLIGNDHHHSVLRDTRVSAELHQVESVFLLNHETCGAYGNNFSSRKEELDQHYTDLKESREIILKNFSQVKVELYFAELKEGSLDIFVIKEI